MEEIIFAMVRFSDKENDFMILNKRSLVVLLEDVENTDAELCSKQIEKFMEQYTLDELIDKYRKKFLIKGVTIQKMVGIPYDSE